MAEGLGAEQKRDLYALCARLFAVELDEGLYRQLSEGPLAELLRQLEPEWPPAVDLAAALEQSAVDYCALFVGPQPACIPFASAQANEALLGGRARARLEAFVQANEIELSPELLRIPSPDHVAVYLAVLSALYDALETADDSQARAAAAEGIASFLGREVLPWVPAFAARVEAAASTPLYRAAARLTRMLLEEEPT